MVMADGALRSLETEGQSEDPEVPRPPDREPWTVRNVTLLYLDHLPIICSSLRQNKWVISN